MTNFNFLLNNLSYLSNEDLVVRPMDSTCFRSAPVPPSFRLRLHPLRMVATLLLLLCIGVGNVWGAIALSSSNVTLNSFSSIGGSGYQNSANYTISGYSGFSFSDCMLSSSQLQLKASSGSLTSPTITSSNGFDIEVTYTSAANMTISAGGSSQTAASVLKLSVSSTSTTFTLSTGNKYATVSSIVLKPKAAPAVAHTVTFTKTDGTTQEITETSVGAGVTPPSMNATCGDWEFQGWSTNESDDDESTDELELVTLSAGKYYPSANTTLYPVYTKEDIGAPVETKTQTFQYDTWTKGGSSTDKTSYRLFHSGGYVESASNVDFSKLSKVIVYGGTYGGGTYNSISIKKADGTVWKNATVSGTSQTGTNTITGGASLTGSAKLRVYSTSGTASGTGVRISKVEVYTMEDGSVTYYYSYPTCCTALGSINGSVLWSNGTLLGGGRFSRSVGRTLRVD